MLKKNTHSFYELENEKWPISISNYLFIVSARSRFETNAGQNNSYTKKKKVKIFQDTIMSK